MDVPIIIQSMDEPTVAWINEESERRGISAESLILDLIHKGIVVERSSPELQAYHELDSLAGTWSEEQATEFLNAVDDFEHVDEKLWQ